MRPPKPPRVASLLLRRLGPQNEPLVGDLWEEYRSGRSGWWYWRQCLRAIIAGAGSDLRRDKLLVLRAIAMGIGLRAVVALPLSWVWGEWLRGWIGHFALRFWGNPTNSFGQWAYMLSWFPAWVCVGWLLAKLNRDRPGAFVLTFVVFGLVASAPGLATLVFNALEHPRFLDQLEIQTVGTVTMVIGVLFGALLSAPGSQTDRLVVDGVEVDPLQ